MKKNMNKWSALFLVYLIIFTPFSIAQDELPQQDQPPLEQQQQTAEQTFENNPTPENFNNLPNPTAADLARVQNPTLENFNHLPTAEQGTYLGDETNYNQDFANQYWSSSSNWGMNPDADAVLFTGTNFRDLLRAGTSQVSVAQQYFTATFGAPYTFEQISNDFVYDAESGTLLNGGKTLSLNEFENDPSIQGIIAVENGFKIVRKEGEDPEEETTVAGKGGQKIVYDPEKKLYSFTDAQGREWRFERTGSEPLSFEFGDDGSLKVTGPAAGVVLMNNEHRYVRFNNRKGDLVIHANGNIEAENAIVETAKLWLDGNFLYDREQNTAQGWEVTNRNPGPNSLPTIIIDKASRVGAKTIGQHKGESSLTVHFSGDFPAYSEFHPPSPGAQPPEDVQQLINQVKRTKPPSADLCGGLGARCKDAEVHIQRNDPPGNVAVSCKGNVDCGFYDISQGKDISRSETEPHFIGHNGLSELDLLVGAQQTQINVRGKAKYTDDQYASYDGAGVNDGIQTHEDGASIKIIRNAVNYEDVIYADCHKIGSGVCDVGSTAADIQKTIAIASRTDIGVFTDPEFAGLSVSVKVGEEGLEYDTKRFLQDLGAIASKQADGKEIVVGRTLNVKNVVCEGGRECNLLFTKIDEGPDAGRAGAFYEEYDPQTGTVSKLVSIRTLGAAEGKATILTSAKNIEKLAQVNQLIGTGQFGRIPQILSDDYFEDDPQLRAHLLRETGIDINNLDDTRYAGRLGTIVRHQTEARGLIQSLQENHGLQLDEFGRALTAEDQQRLNSIMVKRTSPEELAVFDVYTRARVSLARAEFEDSLAAYESCAGNPVCPSNDAVVKEAQQKVVQAVNLREASPEGRAWRQEFERQRQLEEMTKLLEEVRSVREASKDTDTGAWADAAKIKNKLDKTFRQKTEYNENRIKGKKDALGTAKAELTSLQSQLELASVSLQYTQSEALATLKRVEIGELQEQIDNLNNDVASLEATVQNFEKTRANALEAEKNAELELQQVLGSMAHCPLCQADLLNEMGRTAEAANAILGDPTIPADIKQDAIREFLGAPTQERLFDVLENAPKEHRKNENLISGAFSEFPGDTSEAGIARRSRIEDVLRTSQYTDALSLEEKESLAQQAEAGNLIGVIAQLKDAQDRYVRNTVGGLITGKDATRKAKIILKATGNIAAAEQILGAIPQEARGAEWHETDDLAAAFTKEKMEEDRIKARDTGLRLAREKAGISSSEYKAEGIAAIGESVWEGFEWVGEALFTGGRYVVGGVVYGAGAISGSEREYEISEGIINYRQDQQDELQAKIDFFKGQEQEFADTLRNFDELRNRGLLTTSEAFFELSRQREGQGFIAVPLDNLAKQAGGEQLTGADIGREVIWNVENTETERGQYLADDAWEGAVQQCAGLDAACTARALGKLQESNEVPEDSIIPLTNRHRAIVEPILFEVVVSADNFIPGVLIAKGFKAGAKGAKALATATRLTSAVDKVTDTARLFTAADEVRDLYNVAKIALRDAKVANAPAKIAEAENAFQAARTVLAAESRAGILGRKYYLGLTRKGDDLIAVEQARRAAAAEHATAARNLAESQGEGIAQQFFRQEFQRTSQLLDDLQKTEEALHLAGTQWVTDLRKGRSQYALPGPQQQRAARVLTDFQQAREAFHAERAAKGAANIDPKTMEALITTAKAKEEAEVTFRIGSAIKERINAARVEKIANDLRQTGIAVRLTDQGRYVAEIAAGTPEARSLATANGLLEDPGVLQRVASRPGEETVAGLNLDEAIRLDSNLERLAGEGANLKIEGTEIIEVDLTDLARTNPAKAEELQGIAGETNSLLQRAGPDDVVRQVTSEREAELLVAANDHRGTALAVKEDLAAKAAGQPGTGIVPPVAGEEATRLPKIKDGEILGDKPTPASLEGGQRSKALGTPSVEKIPRQGEIIGPVPFEKMPQGLTADENVQRILGDLPAVGKNVRLETLGGDVIEGTLKYSDEKVIFLERFNDQQPILTSRVAGVQKPLTPQAQELSTLRNRFEPLGAKIELAPDGSLKYNLDEVPDALKTDEFLAEVNKVEELMNSPGENVIDQILRKHGIDKSQLANCNALAAAAIYGLAVKCVSEVPGEVLDEIADSVPVRAQEPDLPPRIQEILEPKVSRAREVPSEVPDIPETREEVRKIFVSDQVRQLTGKTEEELFDEFYDIYKSKTKASVAETGELSPGGKSIELFQELGEEIVDIDVGTIQTGWVALQSRVVLPAENRVRFYINARDAESSHLIMKELAQQLGERKTPFKIKSSADKSAYSTRTDNTVLYVRASDKVEVERTLQNLNSELLDEEIPRFTKKVSNGISWGEDPIVGSFGQKRSEALAEIYTATGGKVGPEFDDIAREIFQKHGIDPDQPWLNLNSPLKEAPARITPDEIRQLTSGEIQDPDELDAWNNIVNSARSSEPRLSLEEVTRLESNRLSIPDDDFYAITFDVPPSVRNSLGIQDEVIIKVQTDTPPQGVSLVTDQADILTDLSEVAVPVILRDDKYYIVQKFEGLRLDEMPADIRARVQPQIESFGDVMVSKGYEINNYDGLVYNPLTGELKLTSAHAVRKSSLSPDELRNLHNQKIDDILNKGVVTSEEKAEAITEARRILEEEGAFVRPQIEEVVVPEEALLDLSAASTGKDVKIPIGGGKFEEGKFLGSDGSNIIIETTEPRFLGILPDRTVRKEISFQDAILPNTPVEIRSVQRTGVNRQQLDGDIYSGRYLGEDDTYLYLEIDGTPARIGKSNLEIDSIRKSRISDPVSEFTLNQQKILDQSNRVPIIGGKQTITVHIDPATLRIKGAGQVPPEVLADSQTIRVVVDTETGRIDDVIGQGRVADEYRDAVAGEELYGGRRALDPCVIRGGAIYGLAIPCSPPKIILTSSIGNDKTLVRLAEDATADQSVQRGLDHLTEGISNGNFAGRVRNIKGTDVFYLGHDSGARVYYRRVGSNQYEIVAKSAKGRNQNQVINRLQKTYGHCNLVAAAIYESAPCTGRVIPEALEEVTEPISGARVVETELIVESDPLPISEVREIITPESQLRVQDIIREQDGVVIRSENNLYFVDEQGEISSATIDSTYSLRPGETIGVNPPLRQQLVDLANDVLEGRVVPMEKTLQQKYNLALVEAAKDNRISLQAASSEFDNIAHITHQEYLDEVVKSIGRNPNLVHLHQKLGDAGIPVRYSGAAADRHLPGVLASYSRSDNTVRIKVFVRGEDVSEIIPAQLQAATRHEPAHAFFERGLDSAGQQEWINHVRTNYNLPDGDPAIKSAVQSLLSNSEYQRIGRELPPDEAWFTISNEVFAHRFDFHAAGPSGIRGMELPASAEELDIFKRFGALPEDYATPRVRQLTDLDGKFVRGRTRSGIDVSGEVKIGSSGDLQVAVPEKREGFFSFLGDKKRSEVVNRDDVVPEDWIIAGDNIAFESSSGTIAGRYDGETAANLKVTTRDGTIEVPKEEVDFSTMRKVGDTENRVVIDAEGKSQVVPYRKELPSLSQETISSNRQVLGEAANDPRVAEVLEDLPAINCGTGVVGRAIGGCAKTVTVATSQEREAAESINEVLRQRGEATIEIVPISEPVSGVRVITPSTLLEAAPEGFYDNVGDLASDPSNFGASIHGAGDHKELVNVHGSHGQFLQNYEKAAQDNPVLRHLQQQFAQKGTPPPSLTNPGLGVIGPEKAGVVGFYENGGMYYRQFKNDDEVFAYAEEFFGYRGNNLDEAKRLISEKQVRTLAGHETYHHAFQTHLTSAQKEAWGNLVRNDPNFQNAAQGLRELGYAEEHIVEELFTFRMETYAFGEADLTEFNFIAKKDELDTLKDIGILPADYKRPTGAAYLGDGVYELDGGMYYRAADGNWKQQKEGGFFRRLFSSEKEVDNPDLLQELFIEELNVADEAAGIRATDQQILSSNRQVLGQAADDPRVAEVLEDLPAINCGTGVVGRAIGGCAKTVTVVTSQEREAAESINEVLRQRGETPIEIVPISEPEVSGVRVIGERARPTLPSPPFEEVLPQPVQVPIIEPSGNVRLGEREYYKTADGVLKEKRPWYQFDRVVDPDSEEFAQLRNVAFPQESLPQVSVTIQDEGDIVYRVGEKTYYPTADGRWKEASEPDASLWRKIIGDKIVPEDSVIKRQLDDVKSRIVVEPDGTRVLAPPEVQPEVFGVPDLRPVDHITEVYTPELSRDRIQVQAVVENPYPENGVFVITTQNMYLVNDNGVFTIVGNVEEGRIILRPASSIGRADVVDVLQNQIWGGVKQNSITAQRIINSKELTSLYMREAVADGRGYFLGASSDYDGALINLHGSHAQYVNEYNRITEGNDVLRSLRQKFQQRITAGEAPPFSITDNFDHPPIFAEGDIFASFIPSQNRMVYKSYATDQQIFDEARKLLGYEGTSLDEARSLLAQKQVEAAAGHETFHYAYKNYLTPEGRNRWNQFLTNTDDPLMQQMLGKLSRNNVYVSDSELLNLVRLSDSDFQTRWLAGEINDAEVLVAARKGEVLPDEELGKLAQQTGLPGELAEESFTFRNHVHAFGESELRNHRFEFPPSDEELQLLKELDILPEDHIPVIIDRSPGSEPIPLVDVQEIAVADWRKESGIGVSDVVNPCNVAGGAIVGLGSSIPCDTGLSLQQLESSRPVSSGVPTISSDRIPATLQQVSDSNEYNTLLDVAATHQGTALTPESRRKLGGLEDLLLGAGSEGRVYNIPESGRVQIARDLGLSIDEDLVMKIKDREF